MVCVSSTIYCVFACSLCGKYSQLTRSSPSANDVNGLMRGGSKANLPLPAFLLAVISPHVYEKGENWVNRQCHCRWNAVFGCLILQVTNI